MKSMEKENCYFHFISFGNEDDYTFYALNELTSGLFIKVSQFEDVEKNVPEFFEKIIRPYGRLGELVIKL